VLGGGALGQMNHHANLWVGLEEREVLVANHILLGIFIDCSCIERDMTQTYHTQSHVKLWVLMEFQCMKMS
jgi:hypothetical protein